MTIKQNILKLLSDGKARHYSVISRLIKAKPTSVVVMLKELKKDGLIDNPTFTIVKIKRGVYQAKAEL